MKEEKKLLGVMGGMGPAASQLFYKMIVENTDAKKDQDHLDLILLSFASIPDRTEAIVSGQTEVLLSQLEENARFLETVGADYGVMPCNTSHAFMEALKSRTNLNLIDMIEITSDYVAGIYKKGTKIGIMATDGTIKLELYQKALKKRELTPVIPDKENQKLVMKLIYRGIKGGGPVDLKDLEKVETYLRKEGCEGVVLACTELSCLKEQDQLPDFFIDGMKLLALEAIRLCGGKVK